MARALPVSHWPELPLHGMTPGRPKCHSPSVRTSSCTNPRRKFREAMAQCRCANGANQCCHRREDRGFRTQQPQSERSVQVANRRLLSAAGARARWFAAESPVPVHEPEEYRHLLLVCPRDVRHWLACRDSAAVLTRHSEAETSTKNTRAHVPVPALESGVVIHTLGVPGDEHRAESRGRRRARHSCPAVAVSADGGSGQSEWDSAGASKGASALQCNAPRGVGITSVSSETPMYVLVKSGH